MVSAPATAPSTAGEPATSAAAVIDVVRDRSLERAPEASRAPEDDWMTTRARVARANFPHLLPGALALCACALVLFIGSTFVEHPIWVFEHQSRSAAMRDGDSSGVMKCHVNSEVTGNEVCMPSYAVIGSQVGGVNSLKTLMSQHDMIGSTQKTLHFFNPVYGAAQGVQMCDPPKPLLKAYFSAVVANEADDNTFKRDGEPFEREEGDVVTGDWSDTYFNCECCASTMKSLMPNLRPIVVLRDPVGRAMARYVEENHPHGTPMEAGGLSACAFKDNDYSWADTASKTKTFLEECLSEADGSDANTIARECLDFHSFLGWSMYAEYLDIWLKEFPDMLVLYADDIEENPAEVAAAVEEYLGLPPKDGEYITTSVASSDDAGLRSIAFDSQDSLLENKGDVHATENLVKMFEPHVKRLHDMANNGQIPPLPYKWLRRYSIPVRHEIDLKRKGGARKLLGEVNDDFISTIVDDLNRVNEEFEKSVASKEAADKQATESASAKNASAQVGTDDDGIITSPDELVSTVTEASEQTLQGAEPYVDVDESTTSKKSARGISDIVYKSEELQRLAEAEESAKKGPTWKSDSVRGRFYSDLYVKMDEGLRDELKGKIFVPVTVPYLFQFANEFKSNRVWMDIVGISKAEQERVYHELWREDCTHAQQWSAEDGCCGLSCCFVGGHRQEHVGLRG